MASISFSLAIFLAITLFLTLKISTATTETIEKVTRLHFFVQEKIKSPNATVIKVVSSPNDQSNQLYTFGNIFVFDDVITEGLDPTSLPLGRLQGTLTIVSLDGFDGLFTFNLVFTEHSQLAGSSLTIIGRSSIQSAIKELSVVGGTGRFRFARGVVVLKLFSFNSKNDIRTFEMKVFVLNN